MQTHSVPRIVAKDGGLVTRSHVSKKQLQKILKEYGVRIQESRLSNLESSMLSKTAVYVARKQSSFLILPMERSGNLLRGLRRREVPIRFTALRAAGIMIDAIFELRLLDSLVVMYCGEEVAVVVSPDRFVEARL